jgi:hypothetical protein
LFCVAGFRIRFVSKNLRDWSVKPIFRFFPWLYIFGSLQCNFASAMIHRIDLNCIACQENAVNYARKSSSCSSFGYCARRLASPKCLSEAICGPASEISQPAPIARSWNEDISSSRSWIRSFPPWKSLCWPIDHPISSQNSIGSDG